MCKLWRTPILDRLSIYRNVMQCIDGLQVLRKASLGFLIECLRRLVIRCISILFKPFAFESYVPVRLLSARNL